MNTLINLLRHLADALEERMLKAELNRIIDQDNLMEAQNKQFRTVGNFWENKK